MYDSVRRRPIFRDVRGALRGRGQGESEAAEAADCLRLEDRVRGSSWKIGERAMDIRMASKRVGKRDAVLRPFIS